MSLTTQRMIKAYFKRAATTRWFTGMFQAPPENFFPTEKVELDIQREDAEIAIAVTDMNTGYRMNADDLFVNKLFTPPVLKEGFGLNAFDTIKRQPGTTIYTDPDYQANASAKAMRMSRKLQDKIMRTIELQGAQIMTTGTVTLIDEDSNTMYTIDFKPKSTHFPTAGTAWDGVSPTIAADIDSLCEVIHDDGLEEPDEIHMGKGSFEVAIQDTDFKARFDGRRIDIGTITNMEDRGQGGKYRGTFEVGNNKLDLFTYNGKYIHPATRAKTKYLPDAKVVVRTSGVRMDALFGAVPRIVGVDSRVLKYLPPRISSSAERVDLWPNAWPTPEGNQVMAGIASRPLLVPTDIDSFGCLSTGI